MMSKQKGRLETTKPKEEKMLPPCTVTPLVVNGSRRVLPCMIMPQPQVVSEFNKQEPCNTTPLVVDSARQPLANSDITDMGPAQPTLAPQVAIVSRESLSCTTKPLALNISRISFPSSEKPGATPVPCMAKSQLVNGSRRPPTATTISQVSGDSQHPSPCTVKPLVVNGFRRLLPTGALSDLGSMPSHAKPLVVNGSRSPLLKSAVPETIPSSPPSVDQELTNAVSLYNFYSESMVEPALLDPSYFLSPPPFNTFMTPPSQSPTSIYSPSTYASSYPSVPLWNPQFGRARSSLTTHSSTASSSRLTSKQSTSTSTPYTSPAISSPTSNSSPLSASCPPAQFLAPIPSSSTSISSAKLPPVWIASEDALLRSLVHISKDGANECDPPLSWMEIAERMNAHVKEHGPLGGGEDEQGENGWQQRVYHTNKLARRWGRISGKGAMK